MSELGLSALAERAAALEAARLTDATVGSAAALGSATGASTDGALLAGSAAGGGFLGVRPPLPVVKTWTPPVGTRANIGCDFIDINMGCPLDMVCLKGVGATLMRKYSRVRGLVRQHGEVSSTPLTLKVRVGYD